MNALNNGPWSLLFFFSAFVFSTPSGFPFFFSSRLANFSFARRWWSV